MAVVCPTVTAYDTHEYRAQMELIGKFAKRIHIDLMDGVFAPTVSPPLETVWWPEGIVADIHVMYQKPAPYLEQLIKLKPHLVVIQYEAELDHAGFAAGLQAAGIKAGLGLLQDTTVEEAAPLLAKFDHVMIFSGNLGHHGSIADLGLLDKVREVRSRFPGIEIAWDGGIDDRNARQLAEGGVDVLNVGGFIHKADNPQEAYAKLETVIASL
jgi:ribulose-phosphate 3-epimerase